MIHGTTTQSNRRPGVGQARQAIGDEAGRYAPGHIFFHIPNRSHQVMRMVAYLRGEPLYLLGRRDLRPHARRSYAPVFRRAFPM